MDTPDGPPTTLHSPFSFLVSLSVSLVLCDTAAGGVEAAVLARLHHVALPLWAVTSRLRSCAAAVEAAVVAAVVAAGGAAVAVTDEVLRAAVVGAAAVSIAVVCLLRRRWLRWRLLLLPLLKAGLAPQTKPPFAFNRNTYNRLPLVAWVGGWKGAAGQRGLGLANS